MDELIFVFDLDSTITKQEILPTVAREIGRAEEMRELTEKTMAGELPFKQSFIQRVDILRDIPVSVVSGLIRKIELNEKVVEFMQNNKERCFIVTGNLDVWIKGLMEEIGMEDNYFSSKAIVREDRLDKILSVIDKDRVLDQFIQPFVAVGDGNNDAEMIERAVVGIGYGGVRPIAPAVLDCATHAVYEEETLCRFLERLL